MGRQRNRAAQRAAGVKPANYKSKTSPSYIKYQLKRDKKGSIGRPFYCFHRKRTQLKCQLAKELGLPWDTKFIFRYESDNSLDTDELKEIEIYHGTVVVINKADLSLVIAVRCNRFKAMPDRLRKDFDHTISTIFNHARARNECKTNAAHKKKKKNDMGEDDHGHVCGWMGCCGWRGGTDAEKSIGVYAMSAFTATKMDRMLTDKQRMERFHIIRDFLAGRFASLSLYVFKTNLAIGLITEIPGFDDVEWQHTPNGMVFASNIAVSCDGFANRIHIDRDHTRYAFGLFSLINRATGQPCSKEDAKGLGSVRGLYFVVKAFGVKVALSRCNGLYEILWDSKIPHYTLTSESFNENGKSVKAEACKVTQFGSSCQISKTLVDRIQLLQKEKERMSPAAWGVYKRQRVKTFEDENSVKMDRYNMRKALREQVAKERLAAKVKDLIRILP